MRVLVTGVSGFVGYRLGEYLRDQGHKVSGTYLREPPALPGIELHDVDLGDASLLAEIVDRESPEAIIHLAGLSHVGESWSRPADYFRVNVLGTENLLRSAPGIRILAASSAEIYGAVPENEQPIPEERAPAPQSPYALTKAAMERLVLAAGGVVVRSFNVVGPGQAPIFALPTFARQLADISRGHKEPVLEVGNLTARRDFLHVDDAVEAYEALLLHGVAGESYNLGSGVAHSIREVLDLLIRASGQSPEIRADPERYRPVDLPLLRANNQHLRDLGWSPTRNLDLALHDLWEWTLRETADAAAGS